MLLIIAFLKNNQIEQAEELANCISLLLRGDGCYWKSQAYMDLSSYFAEQSDFEKASQLCYQSIKILCSSTFLRKKNAPIDRAAFRAMLTLNIIKFLKNNQENDLVNDYFANNPPGYVKHLNSKAQELFPELYSEYQINRNLNFKIMAEIENEIQNKSIQEPNFVIPNFVIQRAVPPSVVIENEINNQLTIKPQVDSLKNEEEEEEEEDLSDESTGDKFLDELGESNLILKSFENIDSMINIRAPRKIDKYSLFVSRYLQRNTHDERVSILNR